MTFGVVDIRQDPRHPRLAAIMERHASLDPAIERAVAGIIADVRRDGDAALRRYTRDFDKVDPGQFRVDPSEIRDLAAKVPQALKDALARAIDHVRLFHRRQAERSWSMDRAPGVRLGMRVSPLDSVGLYVPGGKAAYPSTVVMNAVPAQVAGVRRIAAVTPPATFRSTPVVACVFEMLGLDEVYLVGGAQAVAALAYGTGSIARVDKVVGPGNAFVAAAKRQVFGQVAIDAVAGPSEVVVVADGSTDAAWAAADLLSQAEHDEHASAVAITWDEAAAHRIAAEVERQVAALPRGAIARVSLASYGAVFLVDDPDSACCLVDELAPEHVELLVSDAQALADRIRHAGALFLGPYTAEVIGDYIAGPNHVLPTNGTARFASPLGVYDFQTRTSILAYSQAAFRAEAPDVVRLADAEGLGAHARAAAIRLESLGEGPADAVDPLSFVKPAVRSLGAYHLEPHRAPVKLNQNENPHDLPAPLKEEVLRRLGERPWCRYPDFVPASLTARLAAHASWVPEGVLAGNGSNELIQALLAVTVGPGTEVATLDPTFSLYGLLVVVGGGRLRKVPLDADLDFDAPALELAVREVDVTVLCSPNNPTGRQVPRPLLERLLEAARGLVVLDEAYVEFAPDAMGDLLGRHRHLVVLRTFSKAMAMAGLRVGYLLGDPDLVREIAKAKLPYNLNFFSQCAAEVALDHLDQVRPSIEALKRERDRVAARLRDLPGVTPMPTDANFMLVRTAHPPREVFEELLQRGVLVRDVSGHPALSSCFRFNVGTADENDRFLEALAAVVESR